MSRLKDERPTQYNVLEEVRNLGYVHKKYPEFHTLRRKVGMQKSVLAHHLKALEQDGSINRIEVDGIERICVLDGVTGEVVPLVKKKPVKSKAHARTQAQVPARAGVRTPPKRVKVAPGEPPREMTRCAFCDDRMPVYNKRGEERKACPKPGCSAAYARSVNSKKRKAVRAIRAEKKET